MKIGKLYYKPESNRFVIEVATKKDYAEFGRDKFVGQMKLDLKDNIWRGEIENVADGFIVFRFAECKFTVAVGVLIEQCIRIAQE